MTSVPIPRVSLFNVVSTMVPDLTAVLPNDGQHTGHIRKPLLLCPKSHTIRHGYKIETQSVGREYKLCLHIKFRFVGKINFHTFSANNTFHTCQPPAF